MYCSTLGYWFNDSSCKEGVTVFPATEPFIVKPSPPPTIIERLIERTIEPRTTYITQTDPTLQGRLSTLETQFQTFSSQPTIGYQNTPSVTRSFLTAQSDSIINSVGRSIADSNSNITSLQASIAALTTSNVPEGSNLYFTDDRVASYLAGSTTLTASTNYWTKTGSDLSYIGGNIGIGTTSPWRTLSVYGSSDLGTNALAGSFTATSTTASSFPYASTTALTVSGNAYFPSGVWNSSGNVGVGTVAPGAKLDVLTTTIDRAIQGVNSNTSGTNYAVIARADGTGATTNTGLYAYATGASTNYGVRIANPTSGASNYALYADSGAKSYFAGSVGIGISTPATNLHVYSTGGSVPNFTVGEDTTITTDTQSGFSAMRHSNGNLYFDYKTITGGTINFRSGAGAEAGSARNWMTVNPTTGNVGIANTSPSYPLDVGSSGIGNIRGNLITKVTSDTSGSSWLTFQRVLGNTAMWTFKNAGSANESLGLILDSANRSNVITFGQGDVQTSKFVAINRASSVADNSGNTAEGLVVSTAVASDSSMPINAYDSTAAAAGVGGGIDFWGNNVAQTAGARIRTLKETSGDNRAFSLAFYTHTDAAADFSALGERMRINSSGNVGIGTTSPYVKLSVAGQAVVQNIWATSTTATNYFGGNVGIGTTNPLSKFNVEGSSGGVLTLSSSDTTIDTNDVLGELNFYSNDTSGGGQGIVARIKALAPITYDSLGAGRNLDGELAFFTTQNSSGSVSEFERLRITTDGNLGISTTTPSARLSLTQSANTQAGGLWIAETGNTDYRSLFMDTSGILSFSGGDMSGTLNTATLNAAGAWTNASDISYKENITDLEGKYGLQAVLDSNPRFYTMKGTGQPQVGFIAQEMKLIIPEVVEGKDGSMGISYGNLVAVAFQAIKELNKKVEGVIVRIEGIFTSFTTDKVTTKELCVDDVCVTRDQFKAVFNNSVLISTPPHTVTSTTSPAPAGSSTPVVIVQEVISPVVITPEATTTPVVVPEIVPEEVIPAQEFEPEVETVTEPELIQEVAPESDP